MRRFCASIVVGGLMCAAVVAQDVSEQETYLRGLVEMELVDVLAHVLETEPPDDALMRQLYRVELAKLRLAAATDPADAATLVDDVLAERGRLLEIAGDHPERGIWWADQAGDLYFRVLPRGGAALTTMFGRATDAQRAQVRAIVERMYAAATQAELAIGDAIRRVEQNAGDIDAQMERERLVRDERDRRIAFLRGVSALWRAEVGDITANEQRAMYETAADLLGPLVERLGGWLVNDAAAHAGMAHRGLGEYEASDELFGRVMADEREHMAVLFMAEAGATLIARARTGPAAARAEIAAARERHRDQPDAVYFDLLLTDLESMVGDDDDLVRPYIAMMERYAATDDDVAARAAVYQRLSMVVADDAALSEFPVAVTLARAEGLLVSGQAEGALVVLQRAFETRAMSDNDRAEVLFALGRAAHAAQRPGEAAAYFLDVATNHARGPRAIDAMQVGLELAWQAHENDRENAATQARLREALALRFGSYATALDDDDRWNYVEGRLAMRQERWSDAVAAFEQVGGGSRYGGDALYFKAVATHEIASADSGSEVQRTMAMEDAQRAIEGARRRLEVIIGARLDDDTDAVRWRRHAAALRVLEAQAALEIDEAGHAIALLADVGRDARGWDDALLADATRARIAAYAKLNQPGALRRELERLTEVAPQRVPQIIHPMLVSLNADLDALIREGRGDRAALLAEREVRPLAELVQKWLATHTLDDAAERLALDRAVADAWRLSGAYDRAAPLYAALLKRQRSAAPLIFGRAESLFHQTLGAEKSVGVAEKLVEAMALYRRLAAAGEQSAGGYYWVAQLRMLEILDRTGRNTEKILPRIERLRQQDPDFGGEHLRRAFGGLAEKYRDN